MSSKTLFLWVMVICCVTSFMATYTLYHFPGERSVMLILTAVMGLANIEKLLDRRNMQWATLFVILSVLAMILPILNSTMPDFMNLSGIMFGFFFILLKNEYKLFVFDKFVIIISVLLALSLIEFYVLSFTHFGIRLGIVQRGETTFFFEHYLFNMIKLGGVRFQSLCAEPSTVGGICGFMLFLLDNIKKYKKSFYVFLIAGLTSLSLTFIAFLVMYVFWIGSRFNIKTAIGTLLIILLTTVLIGENINTYITERIESEEYDDRASEEFKRIYGQYLDSSDVWFGKGNGAVKEIDDSGVTVGFRREIYEIGVVGVFLIFLAFSIPYFKMSPKRLFVAMFFIVYCISYYSSSSVYHAVKILEIFAVPAIIQYKIKDNQMNFLKK